MKQQRRGRRSGYPISPSFHPISAVASLLPQTNLDSRISRRIPPTPFIPFQPSHPLGRGRCRGLLCTVLLLSFICPPVTALVDLTLHTTEAGNCKQRVRLPLLLHIHAKADPHLVTFIKDNYSPFSPSTHHLDSSRSPLIHSIFLLISLSIFICSSALLAASTGFEVYFGERDISKEPSS